MFVTSLNLAALAAGLALAFAGVRLLARRLPRLRAGRVCGNCGTSAATLTSFTCTGCNQDVRLRGLVADRGGRNGRAARRPHAAAALVVGWTSLVLVLAMVVTIALGETWAGGLVSQTRAERVWRTPGAVREVRVTGVWLGKSRHDWREGRAAIEVLLADGRMAAMDFGGPSPVRANARDPGGRQVFADRPMEWWAVREWLSLSLPELTEKEVTAWSRAVFDFVDDQVPLPSSFMASGFVDPAADFPITRAYSQSSASNLSQQAPLSPFFLPAAVVGWPLLWLAGLAALLPRQHGTAPPNDATVTAGRGVGT